MGLTNVPGALRKRRVGVSRRRRPQPGLRVETEAALHRVDPRRVVILSAMAIILTGLAALNWTIVRCARIGNSVLTQVTLTPDGTLRIAGGMDNAMAAAVARALADAPRPVRRIELASLGGQTAAMKALARLAASRPASRPDRSPSRQDLPVRLRRAARGRRRAGHRGPNRHAHVPCRGTPEAQHRAHRAAHAPASMRYTAPLPGSR